MLLIGIGIIILNHTMPIIHTAKLYYLKTIYYSL